MAVLCAGRQLFAAVARSRIHQVFSSHLRLLFGDALVAYAKIAPFDNVSISAGKLPTLIGDEYTFTFQNMKFQRGLLWNQEPAISDGVQVNYLDRVLLARRVGERRVTIRKA